MATDTLDKFKAAQREAWAHFAPLASATIVPAARLVRHAGIRTGDRVLDVACGTGVVAVTAARLGARVTGVDLTPERLGPAVRDILFDRDIMIIPALSPQHNRVLTERTAGPVLKLVESLSASDPQTLATFRREFEETAADYFVDNTMRQGYLLTRATKA